MRPNQPLTVRVKASVKHGEMPKQINVLVSAVDSGVLNITDYATPDPWQAFFGQKRYGADIYDIYGQVIEGQGRLAALRFGGDGDDLKRGGKPPVNHVNIIAQQAQPITLNEQGEGVVTLPIGDFNGELRVMAQAWTADDFWSRRKQSRCRRASDCRAEYAAFSGGRGCFATGAGRHQSDRPPADAEYCARRQWVTGTA